MFPDPFFQMMIDASLRGAATPFAKGYRSRKWTHYVTPNIRTVEAMPLLTASRKGSERGIMRGSFRRFLGSCLTYLVVFEAAVFGSGQLLHLGSFITAKMLLFALSMLFVLLSLSCGERIRRSTLSLVIVYLILMAAASFIGILRDAPLDRIGTDISPLLSFLLLPFFEVNVRKRKHVVRVIQIIMVASGLIISAYVAIFVSLLSGKTTYADLALWLESLGPSTGMGDFMFDESTGRVFYKGSIYLCIALFFFLFYRRRWAKIAALLVILNLIAIGARGFFLALFLTGLVYLLIGPIRATRKIALIMPMILVGTLLLPRLFQLAGDRSDSNYERVVTVRQVFERTNSMTAIVGNGFGFGVPERPEHMEIVPLEVFYKQGLVGMVWWGALFALLITRFQRAMRHGNVELAYPFLLSSIFIAFESCTNPFINNPIGMTFVALALACLGLLGSDNARVTETEETNSHPGQTDNRDQTVYLDQNEAARG